MRMHDVSRNVHRIISKTPGRSRLELGFADAVVSQARRDAGTVILDTDMDKEIDAGPDEKHALMRYRH